ncbi:EAL domain-containing protein, partial [Arthrospira platensis SPKY1]|nr:EAL domain-containing protein [Arthrospira platensis SPKY1]
IPSSPHEASAADQNTVFVSLILKLAETLNLQVVAEGVETPDQFTLLRQMGCDRFQGYHFGKPAPLPVPAVG